MKETIRVYAFFVWILFCACLAVGCEYAGQGLLFGGYWFRDKADRLNQYTESVLELAD